VRYNFIQQPNQQSPNIRTTPIQRPRYISAPTRVRVASPNTVQLQQNLNAARSPRPRFLRTPTPMQLQQGKLVHTNAGTRMAYPNTQAYIIQTQGQDGQVQILLQQPMGHQNQMGQQIIRANIVPQKMITQAQPTIVQQTHQQAIQQQPATDHHTPTTSTLPKKDGDCDDLEESITATAISKTTSTSTGSGLSIEECRKRQQQINPTARVGIVKPIMNTQRPQLQQQQHALPTIRQRVNVQRPAFQQQPAGLQTKLEVRERESVNMLVIFDNGEQRLITFTLLKKTCTVQELLDQVGIQVGGDSKVKRIENFGSEIDYIVTVGNIATRDTAAITKAAEIHILRNKLKNLEGNIN